MLKISQKSSTIEFEKVSLVSSKHSLTISVDMNDDYWNLIFSIKGENPVACTRESLLKGKDQYGWPPCTNYLRSAAFNTEKSIFLYYKISYLNEEVNRTEPSFSERVPCLYY